jgi:hypothetical protein
LDRFDVDFSDLCLYAADTLSSPFFHETNITLTFFLLLVWADGVSDTSTTSISECMSF